MAKTTKSLKDTNELSLEDHKKMLIKELQDKVDAARREVDVHKEIVNSLQKESERFQEYFDQAEKGRSTATRNIKLLNEVLKDAHELQQKSETAFEQIVLAENSTEELSEEITALIKELIYAAELVLKLKTELDKLKEKNSLISDDLITAMSSASEDANNAVSLTLAALKSVLAAQTATTNSEAIAALEYKQSIMLNDMLRGTYAQTVFRKEINDARKKMNTLSLTTLLTDAQSNAEQEYKNASKAQKHASQQLNEATESLNKAEEKLASMEAGLDAAEAALGG